MKTEVNKCLLEIACDMRKIPLNPLIIKKIYVFVALEIERYKSLISDSQVNIKEHIYNSFTEENKSKEKD